MTKAIYNPVKNVWGAHYYSRRYGWRIATDARGYPIECETKDLAQSVAAYRRHRLFPFNIQLQ